MKRWKNGRESGFTLLYLFLVTGLTLFLTGAVLAGSLEDLAAQGDRAYRDGDYGKAVEIYTKLLSSGYTSGPLLFNLGNAYFKQGRLGPAILNYERAAREMPHDRDVRYNLELAHSRTVDRIETPPRLPIWNWLDNLRDLLPPATIAWGAWSFATLAALFFAVSLLAGGRGIRKNARRGATVSAVFFVVLLSLVMLRIAEDSGPPKAVVMAEKVVVRSAPDPASSEVFHLHEGTKVTVLKSLEGYREIRLADGRQGWLPAESCEII